MNHNEERSAETLFLRLRNSFTSSMRKLSSSENEINNLEKKKSYLKPQPSNIRCDRITGGVVYYDPKKRSLSLRLRKSSSPLNNRKKIDFFKQDKPIVTIYPLQNDVHDKSNQNKKVSFFWDIDFIFFNFRKLIIQI